MAAEASNENAAASQKTPVSLLQEICAKSGVGQGHPAYELLANEGSASIMGTEPTFIWRVIVKDIIASGSHKSKKLAKHVGAKALLEKIFSGPRASEFVVPAEVPSETPEATLAYMRNLMCDRSVPATAPLDPEEGDNPVSRLQDLINARRWRPAVYSDVSECGPPHERIFAHKCKLGCIEKTGEGRNKRLAKRQAAEKVLLLLTDGIKIHCLDDIDELNMPQILELDHYFERQNLPDAVASIVHSESDPCPANVAECDPSLSFLVESELHDDPPCEQHVYFLEDFLKNQSRKAPEYWMLPRCNRLGRYQCVAELEGEPNIVSYGTGTTEFEARCTAAKNSLLNLKLMLT